MVSILILEDEHYTREYLKGLVAKNPLVSRVIDVSSGSGAVRAAEEHIPDIALLDIELDTGEGLNGIDVARMIRQINPRMHLVFLTGYSKYALDAFQVHPYDYILKPFKTERVMEVITTLAAKVLQDRDTDNATDRITIRTGDEILFIMVGEIIFIERQGRQTLVHMLDNIHEIDMFLNELEGILPQNFLRVHKSFIVNADKIKRIREVSRRSYEIEFYDYKRKAQMSRYKFEEYKEVFSPSR
ncbi:MAG: LytTR family DNA-binding domain-containing protein [Bacillota bacterium]|nr:LytTR family DNA-binding domain-containing protein [Bacillota bacterium]NPV44843.1 response regulator transcription factor [Bacillota bacterium]